VDTDTIKKEENTNALSAPTPPSSLALVEAKTQGLLLRMFADPYLLEKDERADLVEQLRECVAARPAVSELRVLLGMALCVNLDAQAAIEEFSEGVRLAPHSFIAHLKIGELWMRLRVCEQAQEHTRRAALLAQNAVQSELARRQAASIRTMMREGVERGGYKSPWLWVTRLRTLWRRGRGEASVALDVT